MAEISIFGITAPKLINSWEEKFYCECNNSGESATYVSKETFVSNEDSDIPDFTFHYVVECMYCEGKWYYCLQMVPDFKYLTKEVQDGICECCGIEPTDVIFSDMLAYGGCNIQFGCETTDGEDMNEDVVTNIANVFEYLDGTRGFALDKQWNQLGCTGWDTLNHALKGEDLFQPALKRIGI
jgi:hypothetical protein